MLPEDPDAWPAAAEPLAPEMACKIRQERSRWERLWKLQRSAHSRTSSRVLVYAAGDRHGYLLLHLGREPDGHDQIQANRKLLLDLATVAEQFCYNGTILI